MKDRKKLRIKTRELITKFDAVIKILSKDYDKLSTRQQYLIQNLNKYLDFLKCVEKELKINKLRIFSKNSLDNIILRSFHKVYSDMDITNIEKLLKLFKNI